MAANVDTRSSANYRILRFDSIDDCIEEVHRINAAGKQGTLFTTGNWTAGQIMAHVAAWIEYGYEGYPIGKPPFFIRWILRSGLKKTLQKGMSRGVRIPGLPDGTVGIEDMEVPNATGRLLGALEKLRSPEGAVFASPGFGAMSHEDRIRLNLRHAELHLGYLDY